MAMRYHDHDGRLMELRCGRCGGELEERRHETWSEWACVDCNQPVITHFEGGTLDLNLQRDLYSTADNDFRLFAETFEDRARIGWVLER